jgi:Tol biopolymer transport system component/DNA-binding winged helix-turn-helix (wHTH) protein
MTKQTKHFYEFGGFRLDPLERQLASAERSIPLTPKAFDVLLLLIENGGHALRKEEFLEKVWAGSYVEEKNLADNISVLRKALGDDSKRSSFIETIPKYGYRFVADVREIRDETIAVLEETKAHILIEEDDELESARAIGLQPVTRAVPAIAPTHGSPLRRFWPLAVAAVLVVILGTVFWRQRSRQNVRQAPMMKTTQLTSFVSQEFDPSLSPDGKLVSFSRHDGVYEDIYVKQVGSVGEPLQLTHNLNGRNGASTWSPDGLTVAFLHLDSDSKESGIFTVPALGGPTRKIFSLANLFPAAGLDWSPDGKYISFSARTNPQEAHGVYLLSLETQELRRITSPPSVTEMDNRMEFSPDGKTIAVARTLPSNQGEIYLVPVSGGPEKKLTSDNRSVIGVSWTPDGKHVVFSSNRAGGGYTLWKISVTDGNLEPVAIGGENALNPTIARSGNRLAFVKANTDTNVWQIELATGNQTPAPTPLISSSRHDRNPALSPDGKKIAFESSRTGNLEIWLSDANGANLVQLTQFEGPIASNPCWSPDGKYVAFEARSDGHSDIQIVNVEGGSPRRLTFDPSNELSPSWSVDGHWIYFSSDRNGSTQLWKMPASGGTAIQITQNGGYETAESRDGKFLFYTKFRTPGVFRRPIEGGDETLLIDLPALYSWGDWTLFNNGIYFVDRRDSPRASLQFFDLASGKTRLIASLDRDPSSDPGLSVTPDGRFLIYSRYDAVNNDIMLVENFE